MIDGGSLEASSVYCSGCGPTGTRATCSFAASTSLADGVKG
jgi:hypothetical protein